MIATDQKCAEKLFHENTRLVYFTISHKFLNLELNEDIVQEGMIGLWKAALNYDYTKDVKFSTYAVWCIKTQILMYLRSLKKFSKVGSLSVPLDCKHDSKSREKDIDFNEILPDYSISTIECRMSFLEELSKIKKDNSQALKCFELHLLGYSQSEIGNRVCLSQPHVSRILIAIRKTLENALYD